MNRKESYKDIKKWSEICRLQKQRYYGRTQCGKNKWYDWQDEMVIEHKMLDHELSKVVGHSVKAIQVRRSRLRALKAGLFSVKEKQGKQGEQH